MRTAFSPLRLLLLTGAVLTAPGGDAWAGQRSGLLESDAPPSPAESIDLIEPIAPPESSAAIEVRGHQRLAWDQPAASPDELAGLAYVAYVNGDAQPLASVSCTLAPSDAGFVCTAALPSLDAGVSVVEIAARFVTNPQSESSRSAPLFLCLHGNAGCGAAQSGPSPSPDAGRTWTTADGVRLHAVEVASGLDDPTDLLPLPDGTVLIAERSGRVRLLRDDVLAPTAALILGDVVVGDGRGLLGLAADPAFATTRNVFAIYTADDGLRVTRYTLAGTMLVNRAVVVDGLPASDVRPAAILRAGPDGQLYLATDAGGDPDRLYDLGSYSGKILRLATDGTTPADQPSRSPVWSVGMNHPVGLAWSADRATLRLVGVEDPASETARVPSTASFAPGLTRFSLPPAIEATDATIGHPSSPVFRDQLLIASATERAILKVSFDGDVPSGTEWLVRDLPGPVTALTSATDGSIYAAVGQTLLHIAVDQ